MKQFVIAVAAALTLLGCGGRDQNDVRRILAASAIADTDKIRESARRGDAKAQFDLGLELVNKTNNNAALTEGAMWIQKSAQQNFPDAEFTLGLMYHQGRGVTVNKTRAGQLVLKAAEHGLPIAQHATGNMYLQGIDGVSKNFGEAAKWFRTAAEKGYADSQEEIGSLFAAGIGVPQDSTEAAKWWEKAAVNGNSTAAFNLGAAYLRGDGVSRDARKAFEWTQKAAQKGEPMAQVSLGRFYMEGWGTTKDLVEAVKLLSVGSKNKSIPPNGKLGLAAAALIEKCKTEMTPEQIKAAEEATVAMLGRN